MTTLPRAEHPRPDRMRAPWMNLNGPWEFRLFEPDALEEEQGFAQDRSQGYDRTIVVPFSWVSPLSGVGLDVPGVGWYRREVTFDCPDRVWLCFGAVDYFAALYVNGYLVARHEGGYTPFETDVTDAWHKDCPNRVELRSEDLRHPWQQRGKQGYGDIQGIWQTVWVENRPTAHIRHTRITTRCDGRVDFLVQPSEEAQGEIRVSAEFGSYRSESTVALLPGVPTEIPLTLILPDPQLWTPDNPALYEGTLTLSTPGTRDVVQTYFGIREVSAARCGGRPYAWILLNGKPLYLNGALDQAFYDRGHFTAPSDEELQADVWRLKRLGLNLCRIHIKTEEPRKLYWMDRLGMLVMADIPCFQGSPTEQARTAYEAQWPVMMLRDINHPSIFSFVMFNETWGLRTRDVDNNRAYLPETQAWVEDVYRRAKALDPTRLIEDNSPCDEDHTATDINTWHFYLHGYEAVRDHIRKTVESAYVGSPHNHAPGWAQTGAPLLNSECGMVWGVDNTAGDSDLAWQYHYMLNEFRLHEQVCGFVFTEFHDVVNEFNGYYRIDNRDKDWGYGAFCRGMTLRDLHSADFVAIDAPPCSTVAFDQPVTVPLVVSSFDDRNRGKKLSIRYELWHDGLDGRAIDKSGALPVTIPDYGTLPPIPLALTLPEENAVAVLSLYLTDPDGQVISRNFTTFDVRGPRNERCVELPVANGAAEGFEPVWTAMEGEKACFGGSGSVRFTVDVSGFAWPEVNGLTLFLEAGAKRVLTKDRRLKGEKEKPMNFFHGRNTDRGDFDNSYWMTDESRFPSQAEVWVDGEKIDTLYLLNDFADARGVLSWHAQTKPRQLDEAGSYGQAFRVEIPSRLIPALLQKGRFALTLRVTGDGGLSLYGRGSGRYPFGLLLRAW